MDLQIKEIKEIDLGLEGDSDGDFNEEEKKVPDEVKAPPKPLLNAPL